MGPRLFLALIMLAASPPVSAQCLLCGQDGAAGASAARQAETPLRVEVETQLDFSRVAVGAMGGAVELDPLSGARRLSGDVVDLGGFAVTGTVTVTGEPRRRREVRDKPADARAAARPRRPAAVPLRRPAADRGPRRRRLSRADPGDGGI